MTSPVWRDIAWSSIQQGIFNGTHSAAHIQRDTLSSTHSSGHTQQRTFDAPHKTLIISILRILGSEKLPTLKHITHRASITYVKQHCPVLTFSDAGKRFCDAGKTVRKLASRAEYGQRTARKQQNVSATQEKQSENLRREQKYEQSCKKVLRRRKNGHKTCVASRSSDMNAESSILPMNVTYQQN